MTVERLRADIKSPWFGEHRSRYRFACEKLGTGPVLDIATGTGFGAAILAASSDALVVGCDVSTEACVDAAAVYGGQRRAFVSASGVALPFRSHAFATIVSFETIEHIDDYISLVRELRRLLKTEGRLILSTPNALVTRQYPPNPFHVREFTPQELRAALCAEFSQVEILGQNLSSSFRVAPFLPGHDTAIHLYDLLCLLTWKLVNRLPFAAKNSLARVFLGRSFFPSDADFVFTPDLAHAHVLLAVCHA